MAGCPRRGLTWESPPRAHPCQTKAWSPEPPPPGPVRVPAAQSPEPWGPSRGCPAHATRLPHPRARHGPTCGSAHTRGQSAGLCLTNPGDGRPVPQSAAEGVTRTWWVLVLVLDSCDHQGGLAVRGAAQPRLEHPPPQHSARISGA